ncbi:hypothetical protein GCM10023211_21420 [Orbus sasakiae]|uniref:Holin n=1 Tax=Orbus sasakiae TaxID=1078475 RepID=A0ABP9NHC1_9GAMM
MNLLKQLINKYVNWLIPVAGIAIILLLVAIFFMNSVIDSLEKKNLSQSEQIGELKGTIITNNQTIDTLKQKNINNQDSLILLRQKNEQSQVLIDEQSKQLARLTNENEQLKLWANTALPDDVIRLYSRPYTIKGSDHYRKLLSEGGAVHNSK